MMSENMNRSAVLGTDARREDKDFTSLISLEHDQFGIKLETLRIVQVHIPYGREIIPCQYTYTDTPQAYPNGSFGKGKKKKERKRRLTQVRRRNSLLTLR